jgi:CRISPR-associated protein Cas1
VKHHLNTLFVTTQGAYLRKQGDAIVVRVEKKDVFRVPMINVGSVVCFGRVGASPYLLGACGEKGISVTLMTEHGRFLAAINGFTAGNVLLRREQYRWSDCPKRSGDIARACVVGKLANYRTILRRAARESNDESAKVRLDQAALRISNTTKRLQREAVIDSGDTAATFEANQVDFVRGIEGDASRVYFEVFNDLILGDKEAFGFTKRSRRPPLDRINALLSFLYSVLANDVRSACEASGLDAAVGFLHRDRPGRPGLALDLMEELRPAIADRVALSLVNRRQLKASDFEIQPTGAVWMADKARKTVLAEYQKRKQEAIRHPFLDETMSLGLVPHIQARLLARHLRGDLDAYPPFSWK